MTSQLNVDTIVDKAGSGGTNVKMGNTSTYVSDGGAVTQNTVQGLAKAWYKASSTITFSGTLNIGSGTDNGTGNYTFNYTNSMADTNYTVPCGGESGAARTITASSIAAGSLTVEDFNSSGTNTDGTTMASIFGDLA